MIDKLNQFIKSHTTWATELGWDIVTVIVLATMFYDLYSPRAEIFSRARHLGMWIWIIAVVIMDGYIHHVCPRKSLKRNHKRG